jgi:hypothetical protein
MRPLRLSGVSAPGHSEETIDRCWGWLNAWVARKSLGREIEIGYGLINHHQDGTSYTACVELPISVMPVEADELAKASLAGGAYFRKRFLGPVEAIGAEFDIMRGELDGAAHVRLDTDRPLVTVFLDVKNIKSGPDVRSNLLIPVLGNELAYVPGRAA